MEKICVTWEIIGLILCCKGNTRREGVDVVYCRLTKTNWNSYPCVENTAIPYEQEVSSLEHYNMLHTRNRPQKLLRLMAQNETVVYTFSWNLQWRIQDFP